MGGSSVAGRGGAGAAGMGGNQSGADAGPPGTLLFGEDFEDFQADADGWIASDDSTWAVSVDGDVASSVYGQTETGTNTPLLAVVGDASWTDVIVQADFKILEFDGSSSSYMVGLCVRVSDEENFYLVGMRSNDFKVGLRSYADGGENVVQSEFDGGATGVWYTLRVEVVGTTISAFLDGAPMFTVQDSTHASGAIGLCTVRASAVFDNVSVTAP